MTSRYIGDELELFAHATNWKAYWSDLIRPFLGTTILDVGAGIGATAKVLADLPCESYLALEPDSTLANRMQVDFADELYPPNFRVCVGTTSGLQADQQFDTILYIDVLEHIADDRQELQRASEHLVPGGRIVVLSPAHQWLYSEFDAAIGHVQRYNRKSLLAAKPDDLICERVFYLDSVGLIASLGNRVILKSSCPSAGQIKFWDERMVPLSKWLDRGAGFRFGKTIVVSFKRPDLG